MSMTDDLRARLEADQRIIDAATEGPWEVLKERVVTEDMDMVTPRLHSAPDAEFIAASRTRWEQANRALLKVLELHYAATMWFPATNEREMRCRQCDMPFPCPTVKAIQEVYT